MFWFLKDFPVTTALVRTFTGGITSFSMVETGTLLALSAPSQLVANSGVTE